MSVPILQSLLLADHVYRDQITGKHIICGVFSTIFFSPNAPQPNPEPPPTNEPRPAPAGPEGVVPGAPSGGRAEKVEGSERTEKPLPPMSRPQALQNFIQAGSPYIYFSVTELTGRKIFEVRYVELNENRALFQAEVPIECDDPLKTIEISLPLPRLPLVALEERSYALEVLCEGQLLGSHRVLARISPGNAPPH